LNTHTKLEEELESKDKKLIQYKKESEKAIKKLAGKVSKLRSKLDAACFNSDSLNEELLGKEICSSSPITFLSES
jgi:hypothetical protein